MPKNSDLLPRTTMSNHRLNEEPSSISSSIFWSFGSDVQGFIISTSSTLTMWQFALIMIGSSRKLQTAILHSCLLDLKDERVSFLQVCLLGLMMTFDLLRRYQTVVFFLEVLHWQSFGVLLELIKFLCS